MRARLFFLFVPVCLVAVLAASGCGKKTRPLPPGKLLPRAIDDLSYRLDEQGIELAWSLPSRTVAGERLPYQIRGFVLERAVIPEKDFCPDCPVRFAEQQEIEPLIRDGKGYFRETLLRPHHYYLYRVRTKAGWWLVSEPSNTVRVFWEVVASPPEAVEAKAGDARVELSWRPPETLIDGSKLTGSLRFEVSRSEDGERFHALASMVETPRFVDRQVENGRRYWYRVRAVREYRDTVAFGMPSRVVEAEPRDLTPPAPVPKLTVAREEDGVKLLWEPVAEKDLAGYRIFRRAEGDSLPRLLSQVGPYRHAFVDPDPLPRAWYSVAAFDQAGNQGEPSAEVAFPPF